MNAINFIISRLELISAKIPGIGIKYAFDKITNFHIVEVIPESIRRGNEEYMEMEYNLCNEFYEKFTEEDLLISEPDEINNMNEVYFEYAYSQLQDKCNSSNEYYSVKFKNTQPNYDINMMSTLAFSNRAVINYSRLFVGFSPKNIKSKEKQSPIDVLYNNAA